MRQMMFINFVFFFSCWMFIFFLFGRKKFNRVFLPRFDPVFGHGPLTSERRKAVIYNTVATTVASARRGQASSRQWSKHPVEGWERRH